MGYVTLELFIEFCKDYNILGNLCSKGLIAKIYALEAVVKRNRKKSAARDINKSPGFDVSESVAMLDRRLFV